MHAQGGAEKFTVLFTPQNLYYNYQTSENCRERVKNIWNVDSVYVELWIGMWSVKCYSIHCQGENISTPLIVV